CAHLLSPALETRLGLGTICHVFWRGSAMRYAMLIASIVFSIPSAVLPGHAQPPSATPAADLLVEDVPLPSDAGVLNPQNVPENLRRFSGAWVGAWGGQLRHILVVEDVMADGNANVVYAVGDNPAANVRRQWRRLKASISGNTLQ